MKKTISLTLIILFITSFFTFFNTLVLKVEASSETDIYAETNTYNVNIETFEKNVRKPGYEKGQYIIEYNMNNKKTDCLVAEKPTVTVFTHGYYSSSRDWLNNAEDVSDEEYFALQYNNESMVDKVIHLYGVNNTILLIANMTDYENVSLTRYVLSTNRSGAIIKESEEYNYSFDTETYGKHIVIIFNRKPGSSNDSNNNLYFQFNYMLSSVLYDLKQLDAAHKIPKVNLIGHSRGGLTNMQYALDHPDIVANLISIGTPYMGSTSAVVAKEVGMSLGDGLNDIIDPEVYNKYANRWNSGYNTLYKKINAAAIGAFSSLPFVSAIAHNDKSGTIGPWATLAIDVAVPVVTALKISSFTRFFLEKIAVSAITKVMKLISPKNVVFNVADMLLNEIQLTVAGPVWLSDTLVPLDSQLALSYTGIRKDVKYFSIFGKHNFNRVAQWAPPVVHNLEPWDEDIIAKVVDHLKPSVVDNTANFKYKENSDGTVSISGLKAATESDILDIPSTINGKTVTGISSGAFAGEPSIIDKFETNAATLAANDEVNYISNVTTINIPSSVTKISADAFNGMENLTTVNFLGNSLNSIGENAFADCVNLTSINLPSGITEISYGAFENCKNLTNLVIPNSVTKISAQAFCGAEKLTFSSLPASVTEIGELAFFGCKGNLSISLPSGITSIGDGALAGIESVKAFEISGSNANYSVKNGILYNKAQNEIIQYPKAKDADLFIANNNSSDEPMVREIKPYAFYDCDNLTKVNIDHVRKVGKSAFANCASLETIFAIGLTNAEFEAFSNTLWLNSVLDNNSGIVVLGELLILFAPENKTVMELSDWGVGTAAIAEQAFALSDVETIYIPSGVSRLNEYAFANAQNLENVYVEKMNDYLLSQIGTNTNLFGNNHADLKIYVTRSDSEAIDEMEQNALTGIPREIISTYVTCINNGITTTQTIYYDEEYTLADSGTVVWESESGERYQNTGIWKIFDTELTLNSIQVNNNWLTYDGEDLSPVPLVEGDIVSLSHTASGVITVTVNGTEYVIDLNLPVGMQISDIKASNGQSAELNNTVYSGQFSSFNVEVVLIEYEIRLNYRYYIKDSTSTKLVTKNKSYTINNVNTVINDIIAVKNTKVEYELENSIFKTKEYLIEDFYSDSNCATKMEGFSLYCSTPLDIYLKCSEIVYIVTLDYGESSDKRPEDVYIPFTKLIDSGNYLFTFPTCEQQDGLLVLWQDADVATINFTPGAENVRISNGNHTFKLVRTCIGEHTLVNHSIDEIKHEAKCSKCDYQSTSDHLFIRTRLSNVFYHIKKCTQCDYREDEAHKWWRDKNIFRCSLCGSTSAIIPTPPDMLKYLVIDKQGNMKEVSYGEALIITKKYELEEQEDVA